jgi:hypothetical protein
MSGHLIPNSFSTYALTDDDVTQGSIFTIGQTQVLQNLLAVKAEEKLGLKYDIDKPTTFIQQEAYHTAQIELLQWLIDQSNTLQQLTVDSDVNFNDPNFNDFN